MALVTRYAEAADLQALLDTAGSWTAAETATHEAMLEAVARDIDRICGRFFGTTAAATVKVFDGCDGQRLVVPDLVSVSALKTDEDGDQTYERTWASADYELWPYGAADEHPAAPYLEIRVSYATGSADYTFPIGQKTIEVTGVWGWPAVPQTIKQVCILEAARMVEQSRSPSGIVANAALGTASIVPALHPTSMRMLRPYIRMSAQRRAA